MLLVSPKKRKHLLEPRETGPCGQAGCERPAALTKRWPSSTCRQAQAMRGGGRASAQLMGWLQGLDESAQHCGCSMAENTEPPGAGHQRKPAQSTRQKSQVRDPEGQSKTLYHTGREVPTRLPTTRRCTDGTKESRPREKYRPFFQEMFPEHKEGF